MACVFSLGPFLNSGGGVYYWSYPQTQQHIQQERAR